ncbi:MAG: OB-fold nucleic acid binding domain-containing protein, partial [Actinomycetota bacterium]
MASLTHLATIDVGQVKGLGGKRSEKLAEAGIETVADLLHHVPRRYIDRSRKEPIARVPIGSEVTIIGKVVSVKQRRPRRNLQIIEAVIEDDSARIKAVWFNQRYLVKLLQNADEVALSGVVE